MTDYDTIEQWHDAVNALPAQLRALDNQGVQGSQREALVALWSMVMTAPSPIKLLFPGVTEAEVRMQPHVADDTNFGFSPPSSGDNREVLLSLVRAIRFLDEFLQETDEGGRPLDPNSQWRVQWNGKDYFVVPVPRRRWEDQPKDKLNAGSFTRRGLRKHRIIPRFVDGGEVRFWRPRVQLPSLKSFGAVLFQQATMTFDKSVPNTFIVSAIEGSDMETTAAHGLQRAQLEDCTILAYPELTIDDRLLSAIAKGLKKSSVLGGPALVLAGSWHVKLDSQYANVATLLDGFGDQVLQYNKRQPYISHDLGTERITPGRFFEIVHVDAGLIGFATCLDFAQRYEATPYHSFDVDLIVVPSCGNKSTMEGHLRTAVDLHHQRGTRSFVVQQGEPKPIGGIGYVMYPDGKPQQINGADQMISAKTWNMFDLLSNVDID